MKKLRVAYLTGSRADFGLMTPVLQALTKDSNFTLQVYYTGMHLLREFGNTKNEVVKLFPNSLCLSATNNQDKPAAVANFNAKLLNLITKALQANRPDYLLVLGDRSEMLVAALAAFYLQIPIVHLHGGDQSATWDDAARNAISKLAHLHLPATRQAEARLKQMGEPAWRIKTVGAPAIEVIKQTKLLNRQALTKKLKIDLTKKYLLVTLHPVDSNLKEAKEQMKMVLTAALSFQLSVIIIYPNADPGGRAMISVIQTYKHKPQVYVFKSLSQPVFLSLAKHSSAWLSNSSAGVIESASLKIPVINIGNRQQGRIKAKNVLNASYEIESLKKAIKTMQSHKFQLSLQTLKNPWGNGRTSQKVLNILKNIKIDKTLLTKISSPL